MLRIALFAIGALVALYFIWNLLQLVFGSYRDRRSVKNNQGDVEKTVVLNDQKMEK